MSTNWGDELRLSYFVPPADTEGCLFKNLKCDDESSGFWRPLAYSSGPHVNILRMLWLHILKYSLASLFPELVRKRSDPGCIKCLGNLTLNTILRPTHMHKITQVRAKPP